MMAERGVIVSHEAVRYWGRKFGQGYANARRRRHPRPGDKWHLDLNHAWWYHRCTIALTGHAFASIGAVRP
jgi:transposase-like protein